MKSLLRKAWFWPVVTSPLAVFGVAALSGARAPGVVSGLGLLGCWLLSFPLGRADERSVDDPSPRRHLAVAGWGLLAVTVLLGGLWWGMSLDSTR